MSVSIKFEQNWC